MKHMPFLLSTFGLLLLAAPAMAAEPTSVRLDTAAAVDFNEPQDTHFGIGAGGALKLTFDLKPWLDVAPSVMTDQFAPTAQYANSGVSGLWAYGLGLRVKRPHNAHDGSMWDSSSPWLDGDVQVVSTGNLARFGYSVGAGISGPMDDARHYWLGPYVRWTEVVDGTQWGGNPNLNHTDASILQFGLELEFDFAGVKKPVTTITLPVQEKKKVVVNPPPPEKPAPQEPDLHVTQTAHLNVTVLFGFDNPKLLDTGKTMLDDLAQRMLTDLNHPTSPVKEVSLAIEVDGYASSENHHWADKHNQELSQKRADAVVAYLVSKGLSADILTAKGMGTANPVAPNDTEANRKLNRRVEFVVDIKATLDGNALKQMGGSK